MLTLSGTPDSIPFGEFIIASNEFIIHVYTFKNLSVLGLCLRINDWFVCRD